MKLTNEQKREIELQILEHKSFWDENKSFEWDNNDGVKFGGSLVINSEVELPNLTSIGGWFEINSEVELPKNLKFNVFKGVENTQIVDNAGINWVIADGIKTIYIQKRKSKGYTIYKTPFFNSGFDYVITNSKYWSHANSIREGILDITFKNANRNKEQFKNLTLESLVSYDEAVIMYRVITGACSGGTQVFLKNNPQLTQDKKYTINEMLELTKGQYGHDTIRSFFEKEEE